MKKELLTSTFERIRARLLAKAKSMLISEDEALDVLQESFFKLWGQHSNIRGESQAEGLLMTTVKNLSIDRLRRHESHPTRPIEDSFDSSDPETEEREENDRQQEILEQVGQIIGMHLSERDRTILLRRDRDGWSSEELAEAFGLTEGNVRVIVTRARKTIREIYRQQTAKNK